MDSVAASPDGQPTYGSGRDASGANPSDRCLHHRPIVCYSQTRYVIKYMLHMVIQPSAVSGIESRVPFLIVSRAATVYSSPESSPELFEPSNSLLRSDSSPEPVVDSFVILAGILIGLFVL